MLRHLPPKPHSTAVRLTLTAAFVLVCFAGVVALRNHSGLLGFYLLYPAIFFASVLFDRGSGIVATLLSTALLYILLTPTGSWLLPREFILPLVSFTALALCVALVSQALRAAVDRAAEAEHAKDLLLQELGHRTKNNLAMVISVLSLQARLKTNPETRVALEKAIARVQAIASAHEYFRPQEHLGSVEMRSYLQKLCEHLGNGLRDIRPIAVRVDSDEVHLTAEQAVPVGLVVNELVTNSFKHAFPEDRAGTVDVTLKKDGKNIRLIVSDDGVGCPMNRTQGLGSRLIQLLARQLGARMDWESPGSGCRVVVEFSHFFPAFASSSARAPARMPGSA